MAVADIVNRAKLIVYGTGVGEKPSLVQVASNANETTSNETVTFTLATDEGAKVSPGDILSTRSAQNENQAFVLFVLSVSTDTVTAVNGYMGSASVTGSDSGDLDNKILEVNPLITNFEFFEAIDQVVAHMLWPEVFIVDHGTIASPDLIDGQEAVAATAKKIVSAHQVIGDTIYSIPHDFTPKEVSATLASTGKLAEFGWIDGSTGYYDYWRPITENDDDSEEITTIIGTGVAAVVLGFSMSELTVDRQVGSRNQALSARAQAGDRVYRDFLTLKQNLSRELQELNPQRIVIDRG